MTPHRDTKSFFRASGDANYYIQEQLAYVTDAATHAGWKRRYDFALQHIRPGDKVLDCGCGLGQGTMLLAARCASATGVDIDSRFIEYCKQHTSSCECVCLDVSQGLPYPDEHFDVVVAIELLDHIDSASAVKRMLQHIHRVLKPEGFLVISVANRRVSASRKLVRVLKRRILRIAGRYIKKQARWHEHFLEWTPDSFREVLGDVFGTVSVFGQWTEEISPQTDNAPYVIARVRKQPRPNPVS